MQVQVIVYVLPLLEGTRIRGQGHRLVGEQAEIGEHELGPVLVQVAEEQQAQGVVNVGVLQAVHGVVERRVPGVQGLCIAGVFIEMFLKGGQQFFLAGGLEPAGVELVAKCGLHFVLAQQSEQLFEGQVGGVVHQSGGHQWCCGSRDVADLRVHQFAVTEELALAHHHAHQQRLCG